LALQQPTLPTELRNGDLLGAGLIDEIIFDRLLETHPHQEQLKQRFEFPSYKKRCEYLCRKAKENYFTNLRNNPTNPNPLGTADDPTIKEFKPTLDKPTMDAVLKTPLQRLDGQGWQDYYRDLLIEAKKVLEVPPKVVLLTGGGSRMPFVEEICKDVFDKAISPTERDPDPSFCVSKGLAGYGRWEIRRDRFLASVDALCNSKNVLEIIEQNMPMFLNQVTVPLLMGVADIWKNYLLGLKEGRVFDDPLTYLETEFDAWRKSDLGKEAMQPAIDSFTQSVRLPLSVETEKLCERYHIPKESLYFELDVPGSAFIILLNPYGRFFDPVMAGMANSANTPPGRLLYKLYPPQLLEFMTKVITKPLYRVMSPLYKTHLSAFMQDELVAQVREQIQKQLEEQAKAATIFIK
jgi:hypothetical protein